MSRIFFIPALLAFTACNLSFQDVNSFSGDIPPADAAAWSGIRSILQSRCFSCHPSWAGWSQADAVAQGRVIEGEPCNSLWYYRLSGADCGPGPKDMPQGQAALTAGQLATIKDWIQNLNLN